MCSPQAVMLASGGLQLAGGIMDARAQKESGKYNAKISRYNAGIKLAMAKDALRRGEIAESESRMQTGQVKADQRARILAGGGTLGGSNAALLRDTTTFGELDALRIRSNSEREAWESRVEAQGLRQQANLYEAQGSAGSTASILGGVGSAASTWYQGSR